MSALKHIRKIKIKNRYVSFIIVMLIIVLITACNGIGFNEKKGDINNKEASNAENEIKKNKEDSTNVSNNSVIDNSLDEKIAFNPHSVKSTKPSNYIAYTNISINGKNISQKEYSSSQKKISENEKINFDLPDKYCNLEGVFCFRGNNFRDNPVYGLQTLSKDKFKIQWTDSTGSLSYDGRSWTGSGWTGQPLMMKWPRNVKAHMNMYAWAKNDDELVEVIYACLDGKIYFLDLKTGKNTRPPLNIGYTFKGSGSLDPRGYPILYLGAGVDGNKGGARAFIINLLNGKVMYEFGNRDSFSLRGKLSYFDSSPLIDAKNDKLIYPGENGILYLIHLNTKYDINKGSISIKPDEIVRWRYFGKRTNITKYWIGMETSAAIYKGYLYIADNGGNLMCLDLNNLSLVWVQDVLDDTNSSPVLSIENGKLYIYISTSFHLGWRSNGRAKVPIWKIDGQTGEKIWEKSYECSSVADISGGVQSTIASGKNNLKDFIYCTISRTGGQSRGLLACINKNTGKKVWEYANSYTWSSPVCVYNSQGKGRVLYCDSGGYLYMLDGENGKLLTKTRLSPGNIEASPAVFRDMLVVGTRACKILGVKIE